MTTANLATLKRRVGASSSADDDILKDVLGAATEHIAGRVYESDLFMDGPQEAILLTSARWFQRRRSPEGVTGVSDLGVIRVISRDPDVEALIERHLNCADLGIA